MKMVKLFTGSHKIFKKCFNEQHRNKSQSDLTNGEKVTLKRFLGTSEGAFFRIVFPGEKYQARCVPSIEPFHLTDRTFTRLQKLIISVSAEICEIVPRENRETEDQ